MHPSEFHQLLRKVASSSSAVPVIANGVVRALSSVSDAFCGTTVALIVSPSTREDRQKQPAFAQQWHQFCEHGFSSGVIRCAIFK